MTIRLEKGSRAFGWAAKTQEELGGHSVVFRSKFKEGFVYVITGAQGDNVLPWSLSPETALFLKSRSDFEGWSGLW